jgi:DNA-binding transcriptional regulator GbsR (MarR family)
MTDNAMQEVVDSLAKIGKHWDLGESVGRVWGFLLFKSCPVTQREIEEGTSYSRGLISRCLKMLEMTDRIEVRREGQENHYTIKTSLTESFGEMLKRFSTEILNPMSELLSENMDKIEDAKVRETFRTLLHEYKKLKLALLIFSGTIEDINVNALAADMGDLEEYVVTVNIEDKEEYEQKESDNKGDSRNGNE